MRKNEPRIYNTPYQLKLPLEIEKIIEISDLFNNNKRDVVCVPTHNFCSLGCKMCHLTNNKLNKKISKKY